MRLQICWLVEVLYKSIIDIPLWRTIKVYIQFTIVPEVFFSLYLQRRDQILPFLPVDPADGRRVLLGHAQLLQLVGEDPVLEAVPCPAPHNPTDGSEDGGELTVLQLGVPTPPGQLPAVQPAAIHYVQAHLG